jgi:hypothetical protein
MTEVGDAVTLTFEAPMGAEVTVDIYDPTPAQVVDADTVAEDPDDSGQFPYTYVLGLPGVWRFDFHSTGAATQAETYWVRADQPTKPPLATVEDVNGRMPLTDAQATLAQTLLLVASAMLRRQVPDIDSRIAAGTEDPLVVAQVPTEMVLRVLRNPEALRQRQQTVGPFAETWSYDQTLAAGYLTITPADLALLAPQVAHVSPRARSIRVHAGLAPRTRRGCRDDWWRWQ